jgi:DNA-binding transcriptional regulator/RsmH inhibitor MraZ
MFVGTHKRSLDEKWRLPLPSDLFAPAYTGDRDNLYFVPAGDHLILFTSEFFQRLSDEVLKKSVMAHRDLRRKFFGNMFPKLRDKNGRIQIPVPLRDKSNLSAKSEVVIIGTGQYAEIRPVAQAPEAPEPEEMFDVFDALDQMGDSA